MSRQPIISRSGKNLRLIFALLYATSLSPVVQAANSARPVQESPDFEILYHEPLDFQFEPSADQDPRSAKPGTEGNYEILSFDAFGKHFELLLESNDRLIADLPQQERETLRRELDLYSGKVSGIPDSWVRITIEGNLISGMIWDGAEMYVVDNASNVAKALRLDEDFAPTYPMIYRLSETESGPRHCGLDPAERPLNDYLGLVKELNDEGLAQATSQLNVAIIADAEFTRNNANPNAAAVARMNVVDGIFSEQVGVQLNIAEIRPLQNNNGLSSTSASTLLRQLGDFVGSAGFNNPGLTHLFTGRNLDGSTIGIAFTDALCNARRGIGISQTRGSGTAGALTVAHELGHNFGSPHDNQSGSACSNTAGSFIMNPRLNGSDQFSQCSISQMRPSIRNAACITNINPPAPPTANAGPDQAVDEGAAVTLSGSGSDPDGTIVAYQWSQVSGPAVNLTGPNQATARFSAPQVTATTRLTFRLVVTDNSGSTASDRVTISVRDTSVAVGADLMVSALALTIDAVQPDALLNYTAEVINQGDTVSRSNFLRLVLSRDAVIDSNDRRVSRPSRPIPELAGGARHQISGAVRIPADTVPGSYFLGAIADPKNAVNESNETNNTQAVPITVNGLTGNGPDLVIGSLSTTSNVVAQGATLSYAVNALNQGTANAGQNFIRLVLSPNPTINRTDRRLTRPSLPAPALAAGNSHNDSGTVTIPADVAPGNYFLGAIVDPSRQVSETNEDNNSSNGVAITVTLPFATVPR